MGGANRMELDVKKAAQEEAEKTFIEFIVWTKRVVLVSVIFLLVVLFACNNGVETGPNATGSKYNGEQYNPSNINIKENK
jgi:hypothetical protein